MRFYWGVDPGRSGGWAVVDEEGHALRAAPLPYTGNQIDIVSLDSALSDFVGSHEWSAVIESPLVRTGESDTGHLNSGKNFGILICIATLRGFRIHTPQPGPWKSKMRLSKDKAQSMKLCDQLFPEAHDWIRGPRGGALDGLAEAILIAEYQRRIDGRRKGQRFDEIPSTAAPSARRDNSGFFKEMSIIEGESACQ